MNDLIERLKIEKGELDEKINKLRLFIKSKNFHEVEDDMQDMLLEQYDVMRQYSGILHRRYIYLTR